MTASLTPLLQDLLAPPAPPDCWRWHLQYMAPAPASEGGRPWLAERARLFKHWYGVVSARLSGTSPAHDPFANRTEEIWICAATQLGKDRSWLNAVLAYAIDCYPRPIGYVMPRSRDLSKILRGRIRPLIERTPRLARHLPHSESARADALGNSLLTVGAAQVYPLAGGVANDLRSTPLRMVLYNEWDIFPEIVQEEGDPIELSLDRMKSYPRDRLAVGGTTPTMIASHGWRRLVTGSHERLLVACRGCGAHSWLDPDRLKSAVENVGSDDVLANDAARWHCPRSSCDRPHTTDEKDRMLSDALAVDGFTAAGGWCPGVWKVSQDFPDGHWSPSADVDDAGRVTRMHTVTNTVRSGWLNALYSVDISLGRFLAHEMKARDGGEGQWRTHLNTWRNCPWMPRVEAAPSTEAITASCGGTYPRMTAPAGAIKILMSCDQQGNQIDLCWFPFVARAFGPAGESWLVDAGEVHGWDELELLEKKTYTVAGVSRPIDHICLDGANGTMRVRLQTWAAAGPKKRFLLRGVQVLSVPWIERRVTQSREKRNRRIIAGARVFSYDSTGFKNELDARIRRDARSTAMTPPWHLPIDTPDFYLQSLTAEERVLSSVRIPGEGVRQLLVWKPRAVYDHKGDLTYRADNHWWDGEVMALVASDILGWNKLVAEPKEPEPTPAARGPEPGDWVDTSGWNS